MALIKGTAGKSMEHEVIVLDLGDLRKQADELLRRAREHAQQILVEAKAEGARIRAGAADQGFAEGVDKARREGHEAGRVEGHAQALAETQAQLEQMQQSWGASLQSWDTDRREMMIEARRSLLELALAVAKKVVHRVPRVQAEAVVDQVSAAIEYIMRPGDVTIRIHPEDRALVAEALPAIVQAADAAHHAELIDDPAIARGGCIVTCGKGAIDATLDTQLDRVVEALLPMQAANVEEPQA